MQQLGTPGVPYRIRIATAFFSHWRLAMVVFASVILIAVAAALFSPNQYQCVIKILVKNDRVTPLVGIDEHTTSLVYQDQISEGRINSEIQLLTNADLLRDVISLTPALQQDHGTPVPQGKALRRLQKALIVRAMNRSNVIEVLYSAASPATALSVLNNLIGLYLDAHTKLNGSIETVDFFEKQVSDYQQKLGKAEVALRDFRKQNQVVALGEEKEAAMQQFSSLEKEALEARANAEEEAKRIDVLKDQLTQVLPRVTKEIRTLPNQYSVERLNTLLVELRNRRTGLGIRYRSDDRAILELDKQIEDTENALAVAAQTTSAEQTDAINPLFETTSAELSRAQAAQGGSQARLDALRRALGSSRARLVHLDEISALDERLTKEVKELQNAYISYSQKRDQARAGELLDRRRVTNVAFIETPFLPDTPSSPNRTVILALGFVWACVLGISSTVAVSKARNVFASPAELEQAIGLPVLATIPVHRTDIPGAVFPFRVIT